jgi:hypothetical protein
MVDTKVEFSQQCSGTTVADLKNGISEFFQNDMQACTFMVTVYLFPRGSANSIRQN